MSASLAGATSISALKHEERVRLIVLGTIWALLAVVGAYGAATVAAAGHLAVVAGVAWLALPVIAWRYPAAVPALLVVAVSLVEQFGGIGDGTDRIPLFTSLSEGLGLSHVYFNPFELTLAMLLLVVCLRAVADRRLLLPRSFITAAIVLLLVIVLFAELRGATHGGDLKAALWELRPWIYLAGVYLITSLVIRTLGAIDAVLWAFVIGTGLKGIQGTIRFLAIRDVQPRPEAILAHEQAFLFGVFIVLVATLWMFRRRGRLRIVATAFLPLVVIADLGNSRRTAWAIVLAGLVILMLVTWIRTPTRRAMITVLAGASVALGGLYLAAFWNSPGALGQPARAIRSAVMPTARDQQSNQYRTIENANLGIIIHRSAPFGQGFGVPIDYTIPLVDISNITSFIKYVPHDTVLYLWMRLGLPGAIAFWWLIGAAYLAAGQLIRHPDDRVALVGMVAICALTGYLIEGYYDMGLFWFRIAVVIGCVLGLLEAARSLTLVTGGQRVRMMERA